MGAQARSLRTSDTIHELRFSASEDVATHEVQVHEGWCQSHEQRCLYKGSGDKARVEAVNMLEDGQQLGGHGNHRGEEERHLHTSRSLPYQDSCEASNEGRRSQRFRQGGKGEGKASKDSRESIPCEGLERSNLEKYSMSSVLRVFLGAYLLWES